MPQRYVYTKEHQRLVLCFRINTETFRLFCKDFSGTVNVLVSVSVQTWISGSAEDFQFMEDRLPLRWLTGSWRRAPPPRLGRGRGQLRFPPSWCVLGPGAGPEPARVRVSARFPAGGCAVTAVPPPSSAGPRVGSDEVRSRWSRM